MQGFALGNVDRGARTLSLARKRGGRGAAARNSPGRRYRAPRQNADQMSPIGGVGMDVAVESFGGDFDVGERCGREIRGQGGFERARAEDAIGAGAGHRDPHPARGLGDKDADQREARGRVAEFHIGRLLRDRKADLGDDLAGAERGLEQALEEVLRGDLALVGDDGRAQRQGRRRIIGGRIVIGDRAADRAAIAHRRIADALGERGQGGNRLMDRGAGRDLGMARHRADDDRVALAADAGELGDLPRSMIALGEARRCFIVGSSVWPPASSLASLSAASCATAAETLFGR